MSDQKLNQPKSPIMARYAKEHNVPIMVCVKSKSSLTQTEYALLVEYAKYDPYLVRMCGKCGMEESACICSQYDKEGNEL